MHSKGEETVAYEIKWKDSRGKWNGMQCIFETLEIAREFAEIELKRYKKVEIYQIQTKTVVTLSYGKEINGDS